MKNSSYHDPYDIWAHPIFGKWKQSVYKGSFIAKIVAAALYLVELNFPQTLRKIFKITPNKFPQIEALKILSDDGAAKNFLSLAEETEVSGGWGLPFDWHSKNGLYKKHTPYVTHTPYIMEALIYLANGDEFKERAQNIFNGTWRLLDSLHVKYESDTMLALSYAPVDEPRIVVNANSYAAMAYAMHAVYGEENNKKYAKERAIKLARWVASYQNKDGSWRYYADDENGNFIDCFHSCFVIKNLLKTKTLIPEIASVVDPVIAPGWRFIKESFFDPATGLCRRFTERDIRDPFKLDIYDQAEFLGLLIDFREFDQADKLVKNVESRFRKNDEWYCRIDLIGRLWGKNFMRWGIMPFLFNLNRLKKMRGLI